VPDCSDDPAQLVNVSRLHTRLTLQSIWGYIVDIGPDPDPETGKRRQRKRFGFATRHDAETALA
jgi:hypothetical protein